MNDKLKNPNLYYIAVPIIAAVWALTAGFVLYPGSVKGWQEQKDEYELSLDYIEKIIELQPERLKYKIDAGKPDEFDFSQAIDAFTNICKISASNYTLNIRKEVKKGGKKARPATMTIKEADIQTVAQFVSLMLASYPEMKCEVLSLEKAKIGKNNWKVDLSLTYYY